jgi:hypothetical protein
MITKTERMMQCSWARYSRENPSGSGYCDDQGVNLERWAEWRLWGLLLWRRREVVQELMPHEWISSATIGSRT